LLQPVCHPISCFLPSSLVSNCEPEHLTTFIPAPSFELPHEFARDSFQLQNPKATGARKHQITA
jgi:hypothetical protein